MLVIAFTIKVKPNLVRRPEYVVSPCMLARSDSDFWRKWKNKQHMQALFENASASTGPDARRSYLGYRNEWLSDHPEHEALIISSSPPLSAACVVRQLALLNLHLCWRCSHCFLYACVAGPNQDIIVTFKKMWKKFLVNWKYWKVGNLCG